MKQTLKKLKSNSGATIIIALMFMLICVFVGGSVLVAATVNGGRLADKRTDQQAILNQRSIAAVIANELSDNGAIDLSFRIGTETGRRTVILDTESSGIEGIRRVIFNTTHDAYMSAEKTNTRDFSVTFTDSNDEEVTVNCTVATTIENGGYVTNRITFKDDPKIVIVLNAIEGDGSLSWYSMKVQKAGAAL